MASKAKLSANSSITVCTLHQKLAQALFDHSPLSDEDLRFCRDMSRRLALSLHQAAKLAALAREHGFSRKRIDQACRPWIDLK